LLGGHRSVVPIGLQRRGQSPFFSRAYGGYTDEQMAFAEDCRALIPGSRICDPMSGQAFALGCLAWRGLHVFLADLNPALLALATLRDPRLFDRRKHLRTSLLSTVARAVRGAKHASMGNIVSGWLDDSLQEQLRNLGALTGARSKRSSALSLLENDRCRFACGISVLAARKLCSFGTTDNLTWLRPGGLVREISIASALEEGLTAWEAFVETMSQDLPRARLDGSIDLVGGDVLNLDGGGYRYDCVITSPPYANRLDYTRMWGPETSVAEAFLGCDLGNLQKLQIGSNIVRGQQHALERLPRPIEAALRNIADDSAPYSRTYYEPFFRNYALQLQSALRRMGTLVRPGGLLLVFVRDTVRRDFVVPTGDLVRAVVAQDKTFRLFKKAEISVRSHIGLRQQRYRSALHGIAQREHFLAFRKRA